MEQRIIFFYFGRRCWCHWTPTSPGLKRQASEHEPVSLRLRVGPCERRSQVQVHRDVCLPLTSLSQWIKTQAELSLWGCSLPLSRQEKKGGEKRKKKKKPSRRTLRTPCQPETAADVEQQHQGPTVPSCPSSSSTTTTERTVKRPRAGGRPTRTKELAAG